MKATIIALVVVGVMTVVLHYQDSETYEYAKSESTTEVVEEPEMDTIEKASQELERINAELDAEEAKLIEEKKAIDARLEKLRETRANFQ